MINMLRNMAILSVLLLAVSGCYLPMSGTIVDAENNQPIEGAVVLVEWTKTIGIGFTSTQSYKTAEVLSNKEGKFYLPGCLCPTANEPDVTIYKKGYVAWNNKIIFPSLNKRLEFKWGLTMFKLERFSPIYSHIEHTSFISNAIWSGIGNKNLIKDAYRWEEKEASKERDQKR